MTGIRSIFVLAFGPTASAERAMLAVAVILTLAGMYLNWNAPRLQMSIEERAKDGRISETSARRRIQMYLWSGPIVIVSGFAVALLALLR